GSWASFKRKARSRWGWIGSLARSRRSTRWASPIWGGSRRRRYPRRRCPCARPVAESVRSRSFASRDDDTGAGARAELAFDQHLAPVLLDDFSYDRQAQAGPGLLGGEERVEHLGQRGRLDPDAGVGHDQA